MLTPEAQEALPQVLLEQFDKLENAVMQDIVRRMKANGSEITRAADWQLYRLRELGISQDLIDKQLKHLLDVTDIELNKIYNDVLIADYTHNADIYKAMGRPFTPYSENKVLQQYVQAVRKQTQDEIINITQSLGFSQRLPNGKIVSVGISEYYQKTLDTALNGIATGLFDYNTALRHCVKEMTQSGLRRIEYGSGWSNRVPVAVRRAVLTGYGQVTAKINENIAEELGTDKFEISYHHGARPSHAEWQGRVYTKAQLVSVCGLGTGDGLCGWNCYHNYYPFFEGISERTYTDEELDKLQKEDKEEKEYNGIKYNRYKAQQQQRKLETQMRAQRQEIKLNAEGGADADYVTALKAKYTSTRAEYAKICKEFDLRPQPERVTIDNIGDIRKYKGIKKTSEVDNLLQKIRDAAANGDNPDDILTNDEKSAILKSFLSDGKLSKKLSRQQQARHIETTKGDGKSYFTISFNELQDIVNKKAGTGKVHIIYNPQMNDLAIKETIILDTECGVCVDNISKIEEKTNNATIHYGKKSSHIVPSHKRQKG